MLLFFYSIYNHLISLTEINWYVCFSSICICLLCVRYICVDVLFLFNDFCSHEKSFWKHRRGSGYTSYAIYSITETNETYIFKCWWMISVLSLDTCLLDTCSSYMCSYNVCPMIRFKKWHYWHLDFDGYRFMHQYFVIIILKWIREPHSQA